MKLLMIDRQNRTFVIEVDDKLITNTSLITYKGALYTFNGIYSGMISFVECNQPVFVG